jgi:hypothetical protein
MTRWIELALGSALWMGLLLVVFAASVSAAPATVSGVVNTPAAQVPDPKATQTELLAMNLDSGIYGDGDSADRKGRYSLKLPAGKWAVRASVIDPDKKRYASFLSAAIVTRAGEQRALPLTLKQFKKPRKRKRHKKRHHNRVPAAATSNVNPRDGRPYPGEAYAVRTFASVGGDADFKVAAKGIGDMLVSDLSGSSQCEFTLVEWERRRDRERDRAPAQRVLRPRHPGRGGPPDRSRDLHPRPDRGAPGDAAPDGDGRAAGRLLRRRGTLRQADPPRPDLRAGERRAAGRRPGPRQRARPQTGRQLLQRLDLGLRRR